MEDVPDHLNSEKGIQVFENAKKYMTGHEVDFEAMRKISASRD